MPATVIDGTLDARLAPRVLSLLLALSVTFGCAGPAKAVAGTSVAGTPAGSSSPTLTGYVDAAIGISFQAPRGLYITPASPATADTTTQAIFSTYDRSSAAQGVDLARELVITAAVVARQPNEDLRAFAARNAQGSPYTVTDMPRLGGIIIEGTFQTGPRKYLLVAKTANTVLTIDAFPTYSSRISIFDTVLATLQLK